MVTFVDDTVMAALVASYTWTTSPVTVEPVHVVVPVQIRRYFPLTAVTFSLNPSTKLALTATPVALSVGV